MCRKILKICRIIQPFLTIACCFLLLFGPIYAGDTKTLEEGIVVDLREPLFCDGVLSTDQGGVITAPSIRIQAEKIIYTRKKNTTPQEIKIEAEGSLMLEFGDYLFVGERLEYDFYNGTGLLYNGRTAITPWFIGGSLICLYPDGSYSITNGYVTTTETDPNDWQIWAKKVSLREDRFLSTEGVSIDVLGKTIITLPKLDLDLVNIFEKPLSYQLGWGGKQGPRIGVAYQFFSNEHWKLFLRGDYRLRRGLGGGIETRYRNKKEIFQTINYVARDISLFKPDERIRYRFQGIYRNLFWNEQFSVGLTYDKLSDEDMAADYADQSLNLVPSYRTQLDIRRQEDSWITHFLARVRINSFETINQELPTLRTSWRPFEIGPTGIISENELEASYLNFVYASSLPHARGYQATRVALYNTLYRPFLWNPLAVTPNVGATTIFYGNSPSHVERWVAVGNVGCNLKMPYHKNYSSLRHVFIPYADYQYYTFPVTAPNKHYIFDIDDGWYRLNQLHFGTEHSFYTYSDDNRLYRYFWLDLYANAFFNTHTIPQTIPKVYADMSWKYSPTISHLVETAWDFEEGQLDHFNTRLEWTVSSAFAFSFEYRHRDAFDWRKADHDNYFLDGFRSIEELKESALSDPRDTVLFHFFYRIHPSWAVEFQSEQGWHQRTRTRYTEFEIRLFGSLRSACNVQLMYQHRESDDRVAVSFSVGAQHTDHPQKGDYIPRLTM